MTNKEKQYAQTTYKDKLEEIEKCLKRYTELNDIDNINFFKGQKALLQELNHEYNIFSSKQDIITKLY
jgi:hypothetical protein